MTICVVERKTFEFCQIFIHRSKFIRLTERSSNYAVSVELQESSISWLVGLIRDAKRLSENIKLVKTKDEGDRVIIFQRRRNDRGGYIVLSVTPRSSRGQHIIISEDHNASRWENFGYLL